jgi:hypothetical protein
MAYSHKSGVSGSVTVPTGKRVIYYSATSTLGGTITVTNAGESAQDDIVIPAGGAFDLSLAPFLNVQKALPEEGATFDFVDTDAYFILYVES